jgi:GT2 family glycosyltransferase
MNSGFPDTIVVSTISRWPTTLPPETVRAVLEAPRAIVRPDVATSPHPRRISIIVLTFDNLVFTILCVTSVLLNTRDFDYELLVVDNGSTDGVVEYLREIQKQHSNVRVVFNDTNRGFAAANNQGLALASGDILVLLNNDTIVPPGWLGGLIRHLDDPAVGLVGPVTNRAGNEAEISVPYRTYGELLTFARARDEQFGRQSFDLRTATMFCTAMRRDVFERVGPLDERFGTGLFEDDDYSVRVRRAGYRVVCADGTFVHHFGQASIGRLGARGQYGKLFRRNRRRWERKWNTTWTSPGRRHTDEYRTLVGRVREAVFEHVPRRSVVAVISRGDEDLLQLGDRIGCHFPQADDGTYAGHYPADSAACILEIDRLRRAGLEFVVVPAPSLWWLDHYKDFAVHLHERHRLLWRDEAVAAIFDIRGVRDGATR